MSPNDDTRDEELLARYRRASADAPGPSDAVRAAILAESQRVAAELGTRAPQQPLDVSRPAANDSRWKITAFSTAGAALLAALLFAPRYWENAPPAQVSPAPPGPPVSSATQTQTEAQAKDEAPKLEELKKSSKSSGVPSLNPPVPAPSAPPSVAQNYAPGSPSASPSASNFAAATRAPAARANPLDLSAYSVVGGAAPDRAGRADSTRAGSALTPATLHSAAAQGDVTQAATMLDQGAVIDARDAAGRTPLMLAVTQGRLEVVRLLLARGADPNAADNTGNTPLQQATKRNMQDVAALLEQAGAH
jgi:Ankyrin repeats (3 copies)